jgi:hypothetical protein
MFSPGFHCGPGLDTARAQVCHDSGRPDTNIHIDTDINIDTDTDINIDTDINMDTNITIYSDATINIHSNTPLNINIDINRNRTGYGFLPGGIALGQCRVNKKWKLFDLISGRNETAKIAHSLEGLWRRLLLSFFLLRYYMLLKSL